MMDFLFRVAEVVLTFMPERRGFFSYINKNKTSSRSSLSLIGTLSSIVAITTYVTGSGKRYTIAHTMIFLYKRCCSKTRNIFIH